MAFQTNCESWRSPEHGAVATFGVRALPLEERKLWELWELRRTVGCFPLLRVRCSVNNLGWCVWQNFLKIMQGSYLWLLDITTHAGVALAVTQWPVNHQAPLSLCYPNKLTGLPRWLVGTVSWSTVGAQLQWTDISSHHPRKNHTG